MSRSPEIGFFVAPTPESSFDAPEYQLLEPEEVMLQDGQSESYTADEIDRIALDVGQQKLELWNVSKQAGIKVNADWLMVDPRVLDFDKHLGYKGIRDGDDIVVGRKNQPARFAHLATDGTLSREHFRVRLKDGQVQLEDMESTNGTKLTIFRDPEVATAISEQELTQESLSDQETLHLGQLAVEQSVAVDMGDEAEADPLFSPEQLDDSTQVLAEILKIDDEVKELMADLASSEVMELRSNGEDAYASELLRGNDRLVKKFEQIFAKIDQIEAALRQPADHLDDKLSPNLTWSSPVTESLRQKLKAIKQKTEKDIYRAGLNWANLKKTYADNIALMDVNWVRQASERLFGFSSDISGSAIELAAGVKSYNELLHLAHSYVMSNEQLRDVLQPWSKTINAEERYIRGLGQKSPLAEDVYQQFINSWRLGDSHEQHGWRHTPPYIVDVLALDKTLQIVVRDYGHALNLTIDNTAVDREGKLLVHYSIPKVTSEDLVRKLPGLSEIRSGYARGQWKIEASRAGEEIIDFVKKVPTDHDMRW